MCLTKILQQLDPTHNHNKPAQCGFFYEQNMEYQDSHMTRVLALLKRQPGMTVSEIAASLSGMVSHEARKALTRLKDAGFVTVRKDAQQTWFAVAKEEAQVPVQPSSVTERPPYKLQYEAPARGDALAHTLIGSRRGDDVVPFGPPIGMESVPIKEPIPIDDHKRRSPINSSTFCKRVPLPAMDMPCGR